MADWQDFGDFAAGWDEEIRSWKILYLLPTANPKTVLP